MGPETLWDRLRGWIGSVAWDVFLWANKYTDERYWELVYQQEKRHKEENKLPL